MKVAPILRAKNMMLFAPPTQVLARILQSLGANGIALQAQLVFGIPRHAGSSVGERDPNSATDGVFEDAEEANWPFDARRSTTHLCDQLWSRITRKQSFGCNKRPGNNNGWGLTLAATDHLLDQAKKSCDATRIDPPRNALPPPPPSTRTSKRETGALLAIAVVPSAPPSCRPGPCARFHSLPRDGGCRPCNTCKQAGSGFRPHLVRTKAQHRLFASIAFF